RCQNCRVELPTGIPAPVPSAQDPREKGVGSTAIAVPVLYSLVLAAGGACVFYASIHPVSVEMGYFTLLDPWHMAYSALALVWLRGSIALRILGLAHLYRRARLNWSSAVAWVFAVASAMAVGRVILDEFGLLFSSYPKDFDGSPLGPSRWAPATPYWHALIVAGGQLTIGALMIVLITALSRKTPRTQRTA